MVYSQKEEIANAITHGIGALLSIAALVLLIVFSSLYGSAWHIVSFTIFGTTLVLLYVFSTLLHSFKEGVTKNVFEVLDHSAIYLLIAGTYTPFVLVTLRGPLGWTLFGIIWGLAVMGIIFKVFFVKKFIVLSTLFYILMGWMILFGIKPLYENILLNGFIWLVLGGVLYTVGTIFYVWRKFPYHHAVWHLFVVGGSVSHFFAVLYLLPDIN
ncbi:PAQR family membrane homeostasis protein TrhA [Chengkuizengella axinellae]|uniref:Hemolysin III family protein n=1 Tax=Chengkuizengella axinellae TaxID=3064388 RepID=A0ABT9J1W8_9BACL|nr:hemolysin III family protein [Chengkuizengella sp. 2205SS18-9]MDP5275606.1 hemolysin III family protein [Chengkuizengella sp. 2205SS18-9]